MHLQYVTSSLFQIVAIAIKKERLAHARVGCKRAYVCGRDMEVDCDLAGSWTLEQTVAWSRETFRDEVSARFEG